MPNEKRKLNILLIAAITPYFLERGGLWFEENFSNIKRKAYKDSWWKDHTAFIAEGSREPFSPFLRKLAEMGYVKVGQVENRGEFAARGGIVDVFPINLVHPIRIEFSGNIVEGIASVALAKTAPAPKAVQPRGPSDYEKMWLSDLQIGDYLVHLDHGIGIFRGFAAKDEIPSTKSEIQNKLKIPNSKFQNDFPFRASDLEFPSTKNSQEFFVLEYALPQRGGVPDRLLIPREQSKKLSRYIGFEEPAIHRLGGTIWSSTKKKAKADAAKLAQELFELFKKRASSRREPYPRYPEIEKHLEETFDFEETGDQKRTIAEIHDDLAREKPMDRLILGDVGFGKTEVAIRAASRVAYSGKQVAVLVPTTILADQHYGTFRQRLKGLPIEIALLSRLTSKKEAKRVIEKISAGKTDIVIGTHRLLSHDVTWKNLGLAVIDEEQRFGVRHKERFKELRSAIDILSLSATPIPRTLSLAIAKLRNLSVIRNPPRGRLPVKTFVLPFSKKIIAEAILAERKRKGQAFYLWNRIENIEAVRRDLEKISPQSRIAILHGRMRERELVRVMHKFRAGEIDVLLATTIIENGLDLPSVNTLMVANAARLGLAQAYQIRGRVGRGDKPAYAYFLYPAHSLTDKSKLRLKALKEAEALGSGFELAMKDLEIRGAGNVLGKQQSGTINKVGLNLYSQLLNEALEELS
ncbi:MAG: DEAD/DEAH box helicase [Candidatus Sungbacteria bacterium]|nr:DEAD/DEAH box helicase [Candidatus Sungbacteria bacterium]